MVEDPNIKTFLQAAAYLYEKGFRSATFIAGEDDMASMRPVLEQYNGKEVAHGYYSFQPLTFMESPRLTSATNAREAAKIGDPDAFERATQVPQNITVNGKTLFQAVRIGMGLGESVEENLKEFAPNSNDGGDWEPGFSEEMLRKFQQDVDFRFQEMQPKGGARPAAPSAQPAPAPVPPQRRGDLEPELGQPSPNLAQMAARNSSPRIST